MIPLYFRFNFPEQYTTTDDKYLTYKFGRNYVFCRLFLEIRNKCVTPLNDSTDYILEYHLIKFMAVFFVLQNLQIIKQLERNNGKSDSIQ